MSLRNRVRRALSALVGSRAAEPPKRPEPPKGECARRIEHRHYTFWDDPSVAPLTPLSEPPATEAEWKQDELWQRRLSDKRMSRAFAELHGCRVPELHAFVQDTDTLDLSTVPDRFVVRPTRGWSSRGVFLIDDGRNLLTGERCTKQDVEAALRETKAKAPEIDFLVESFVQSEDGTYRIPEDYKFFAFDGHIACIQVIQRLGRKSALTTTYDVDWNQLPEVTRINKRGQTLPPPECLDALIEQARLLSRAYEIFVRVDFYATPEGPVFGEFTPTPAMGLRITPEGDKRLLEYWDRYCPGRI